MSATDRRTAAAVPGDPDDPDPDVARAALLADTRLDGAAAARLRDESRRSRPRIERRLVTSGHLAEDGAVVEPGPDGGPSSVDAWRDLDAMVEGDVELLEHIDALHERRLRSPSPRERQAATRMLAEALHRIVMGYDVQIEPPHRAVLAGRRVDERLGQALARLAVVVGGRRRVRSGVTWWSRYGLWTRLALALTAALLLAVGVPAIAAAVVAARATISGVLFTLAPSDGRRRRVLGYDPVWAAYVSAHLGEAAMVAGLGLGLYRAGQPAWGVVVAFAALFSLVASMLRVASGHYGFRLDRLWIDRVVTTCALVVAMAGAALADPGGPGLVHGVPTAVVAVAAVVAVGVMDIGRTLYWAFRRRRLFRQARASELAAPDVLVARTGDAVVMNIAHRGPRRRVLDPGPVDPDVDASSPHLRVVGGDGPHR